MRRIAAICTGIYGLASTGLLDGREVTTHWRFANDVARRFPKLRLDHKRPLVKDGPFYTSSSLTAAIDLSLDLIEEDYGRHIALSAAQELGTPLTHRNGQHEFWKPCIFDSQPTDRFAELVAWIMRNLNGDLSVNALARRACMSPSHFNRAFKSLFGSAPGSLWRPCASTKQSVAYPFRSELSRPSLPLLAFQTRKHSGAHSNADLERSRALILTQSIL